MRAGADFVARVDCECIALDQAQAPGEFAFQFRQSRQAAPVALDRDGGGTGFKQSPLPADRPGPVVAHGTI